MLPRLRLTRKDLEVAFRDPATARRFPPVLTVEQVADLLQVSKDTVYAWSSQGRLRGCCRRAGKRLRILRDHLLLTVFNEGLVHRHAD